MTGGVANKDLRQFSKEKGKVPHTCQNNHVHQYGLGIGCLSDCHVEQDLHTKQNTAQYAPITNRAACILGYIRERMAGRSTEVISFRPTNGYGKTGQHAQVA